MRRVRIIVEEFDPPITLPAYLSGRLQDDPLEHLPAFHGLDCTNQAMATMGIAQSALAPLLLGREQVFHRRQLRELIGS